MPGDSKRWELTVAAMAATADRHLHGRDAEDQSWRVDFGATFRAARKGLGLLAVTRTVQRPPPTAHVKNGERPVGSRSCRGSLRKRLSLGPQAGLVQVQLQRGRRKPEGCRQNECRGAKYQHRHLGDDEVPRHLRTWKLGRRVLTLTRLVEGFGVDPVKRLRARTPISGLIVGASAAFLVAGMLATHSQQLAIVEVVAVELGHLRDSMRDADAVFHHQLCETRPVHEDDALD